MFKRLCPKHQHSPLMTYLNVNSYKVEFMCNECIIQKEDDKGTVNFTNLILIEKAFKDCDYLLSKLKPNDNVLSQFKQFSINLKVQFEDKIDEIQKQMVEINKIFEIMINQLKDRVMIFKILNQDMRLQLEQILEYKSFQQIITDLNETEPTTGSDAIQQIENKLQVYFNAKLKDNSQDLNNKLIALVNENQQKLKDIESFEQYCNFECSLQKIRLNLQRTLKKLEIKNNFLPSDLISNSFYKTLTKQLKQKTKRKIESFQLIYLGTRDNLYAKSFWAKVQGKKSLLMIFKSQGGNVFGGFSPCTWNQDLKQYVQDSTNQSFLFSQTFNEIYPIINNNQAIYCNSDRGPSFGGGHDLHMNSNFEGSSHLNSYKLPQQVKENKFLLLGEGEPKVVECEVYQVKFQ